LEALFAVLAVGGLALGVYELGQAHLKRRHAAGKARAAEEALANGPDFKATARLLKARREGNHTTFSGLAIDTQREKLALVCPGPSNIDSYLEGRIDRETLDEAIHNALLRESVRAYLRRKLGRIETPSAADGVDLIRTIDRHGWSCGLIERPVRSAVVDLGDVIEAEVLADGKSIAKAVREGRSARGDQIVRQVAARRMAHKSCVGIYLKILVNDLDEPLYLLDLCENVKEPPLIAQENLQEALQWHEILRVVLTRRPGEAPAESGTRTGAKAGGAKAAGSPAGAEATAPISALKTASRD